MNNLIKTLIYLIFLSGCSSNTIDPTGTYKLVSETEIREGNTYGYFGDIQVKQIEPEKIVMTFFVCRGAPSYNMGAFVDTMDYKYNKAVYTCDKIDSSCVINYYFSKKGVKVVEISEDSALECGFGQAVRPSGFFKVISRKSPILKDPFNGRKL